MSEPIRACHDPAPPPDGPDLRAIDLVPSAGPDRLDDGTRAHLAQAGQDALEACLSRFAPAEREAFWRAICRCYNRPYNPPEVAPPDIAAVEPGLVEVGPADAVPAAHVIDAVRPGLEAVRPEAALR